MAKGSAIISKGSNPRFARRSAFSPDTELKAVFKRKHGRGWDLCDALSCDSVGGDLSEECDDRTVIVCGIVKEIIV